jgi:CRP-like cAMP-binding protein
MVSPETLKRYPFFGKFDEKQLKQIAIITEEVSFKEGALIFEECATAEHLYLLLQGSIELFYRGSQDPATQLAKEIFIVHLDPEDVFGVSAVIEPNKLKSTAKAVTDISCIRISAAGLQDLFKSDERLYCRMMSQIAKELMDRLIAVQVQLAAAQS